MEFTVEIQGLDEIERNLLSLAPELAEKSTERAVEAGAEVIAQAIDANAPRLTGEMASEIGYDVQIGRTVDSAVARIGVIYRGKRAAHARNGGTPSTEDPGVYADFVEEGTSRTPPNPFMRSAFETSGEAAIQATIAQFERDFEGLK